jgi:hypothetical protein
MSERTERATLHEVVGRSFPADARAARILAKAIYKEARGAGMEGPGLIAVATELIGLVTEEMRSSRS